MNYAIYSIKALSTAGNPVVGLLLPLLHLLPSGR
jgi:hypothetical protein